MEANEKDNDKQKNVAEVVLVLFERVSEILAFQNDKELEILNN